MMRTVPSTDLLVWAVIAHMVADWLLQTEWMAKHKTSLRHPASWVHSGVHAAALLLVFPWPLAVGVGFTHLLIDTRVPVDWWMKTVKGVPAGSPAFRQIEIWLDQVFHVLVLAVVVILFAV